MTALTDAEKAVKEARARMLGYLQRSGLSTARANANLDNLIEAVRRHDAEIVRDMDPIEIALAGQYAGNDIAERLSPTRCACEQHTDNESCVGPA